MAVVWGEGTSCATLSHPQTTARNFFFLAHSYLFSFSPNAEPLPRLMKIIAELSCARSAGSGEAWVRNFGPKKNRSFTAWVKFRISSTRAFQR